MNEDESLFIILKNETLPMKTLNVLLLCFIIVNGSLAQTNKKPLSKEVVKAYFLNQKVKAHLICTAAEMSAEYTDAQAIMHINQVLMGMEKEGKLLAINLLISSQPIQDNILVFGVESEKDQKLSIEMYDEEGFAMVVNCDFELKAGGSFQAVGVENIKSGVYNLRIKDNEGSEINRRVKILKE